MASSLQPSYQAYAQSWDKRHQMLIDASPDESVDVPPLNFNMAKSMLLEYPTDDASLWVNNCMAQYYDVEAVRVINSAGRE